MRRRRFLIGVKLLAVVFGLTFSRAQSNADMQDRVYALDRQGTFIRPSAYRFLDEEGSAIRLDQYFNEKPVLLTFVYFECPGACSMLLNSLVTALTPHVLLPGRDFELVVVSINPKDGPVLAEKKKATYLAKFERPDSAPGWHFLTGDSREISALTETLGFHFVESQEAGQFNHPSVLYFLTPEGLISSQLSGLTFEGARVREALMTARERGLGRIWDRVSAFCYAYSPHVGFLDRPSRWLILVLLLFAAGGLFYLRAKGRKVGA